ncbi:DUF2897 family protein [Pseudoalteromonas sp. T1lg65]|uniref:DUF2897 family protein n=1 Tax=Pseudoalteromonas sp. T1lg65 TaxID=2077101 RepID=UPI003F79E7F7
MTTQLETWQVVLIIVGVLGMVMSNIALLKYAAKHEMKRKSQSQQPEKSNETKPFGESERQD